MPQKQFKLCKFGKGCKRGDCYFVHPKEINGTFINWGKSVNGTSGKFKIQNIVRSHGFKDSGKSLAELHRECREGLEECTKYTFTVCKGDAAVDNMETARDFLFFLRFICGVPNRERGFIGPDTFFLSLTYSNVREYIVLDEAKKQAHHIHITHCHKTVSVRVCRR